MKRIMILVISVLSACGTGSLFADDIEMKGFMQYDVSDSVIPDWLGLVGNWGLFRLSLHKVWGRQEGVDADVTIRNLTNGNTYTYNLKRTKKFNLPNGRYRVKCDKYDVSLAERRGERNYCINRDGVFHSHADGNIADYGHRGCRQIEVMFYPKGSAVTVKGRIVDEQGHPVVGIEVYGEPDTQSEAYYHDPYRIDGSSTYKTLTNEKGEFVFEDEPPAAVELGVYYLLTGRSTKPMQRAGEVALGFDIRVPGYYFSISKRGFKWTSHRVPLISAANLPALRKVTDKLRSYMPEDGKAALDKMKAAVITLPVSTNNVIYVGDLVVHKDSIGKSK